MKKEVKKYKVTYRNGMEQFGTMNTDLGGGRFMLNLFNLDKGEWKWNYKLGGPACFNINTNDDHVVSMEVIKDFPPFITIK